MHYIKGMLIKLNHR